MKNWKRFLCGLLIAGLGMQLFGCASAPEELQKNTAPSETVSAVSDTEAAMSAADFSVELLQKMQIGTENCILSPHSILVAMAMAANGANGATLEQMESVFGMPIADLDRWLTAICKESGTELISANSIWIRDTDESVLSPEFLQTNEDCFGAKIESAPFDLQTVEGINNWVSEQTKKRIPTILDSLSADSLMVLLNALTFDAAWQSPYTENDLFDGQFTAADGTVQNVTMMHSKETYYLEDEMATGFLKDYEGGRYSYVVLLPKEGVSVQEYISALKGQALLKLIAEASDETVQTQMPAYTAETSVDLSPMLQEMGMTDAFSPAADFSKIGNLPMNISGVLHKTYLKVHAGGTEAAAATAIVMEKSAMPIKDVKEVIVDRPYVMAIIDQETDAILFFGVVNTIE